MNYDDGLYSTLPFLAGGSTHPVLRQLVWTERELLRAHLLRLSPQARRSRFSSVTGDAAIDRYVDRLDWSWDTYRVIGAFIDGELRGVAECRMFGPYSEREAELAFSVEDAYQRHGIGSALFRRIVALARNRGMRKIAILTDAHNFAMQAIASRHGMELHRDIELEGHMVLEGPTPLTIAEEMFSESSAWVFQGLMLANQHFRAAAWPRTA